MRFLLCVLPILGACIEQDLSQIKDAELPDTADTSDTSIPEDPLLSVALSPDPVYTQDVLQASASHPDGSEAVVTWRWEVNTVDTAASNPALDGATWFDKDDVVQAIATSTATGGIARATIVVSNTPPTAPGTEIFPEAPQAGQHNLVCTVVTNAADDDNDAITYSATWTVDGAAHTGATQTNFSGDTISSADTVETQEWVCTVTPNDGEEDGPTATATVVIGAGEPTPELADCTENLASLAAPVEVGTASGGGGYGIGAWMTDADPAAAARAWVMMDYDNDQVMEYASVADVGSGSASHAITLVDDWAGTGHVVVDGVLYYNEEDSPTLVALDLDAGVELARQDLPDAGYDNTYAYSYGATTDIDFAADAGHLYVVYSTAAAAGRIVVSEVNPATLTVLSSWTAATATKIDFANTFIACGVLYGINSETANGPCFFCTDTTIDLAWNLASGAESAPGTAFTSPGTSGYIGAVDYNPADGLIYVMRGGVMGQVQPSWN